jgi:protein-tyrosine phosphatase
MGRTGIVCASYLIYSGKASTMQEALAILIAHRKGMMGKSKTQECVKKFELWLTASRR